MKKVTHSIHPQQSHHKHKYKNATKHKPNKFNPLEYLNSLIDQIHEQRFLTVRKKSNSLSRSQRTSALAYVTPITERTTSPSKGRSKSAFSQQRKKTTMKEILKIDLTKAITEEDNLIHFTQQTLQDDINQNRTSRQYQKLSILVAAKRIQRAWRKYKTLQMLQKYYSNDEQREKDYPGEGWSGSKLSKLACQKDFQRTLKIKKNHSLTPFSSLQHPNSQNTTKELFRHVLPNQLHSHPTVQLPANQQGQQFASKDLRLVMELFKQSKSSGSIDFEDYQEMGLKKELSSSEISSLQSMLVLQNRSTIRPSNNTYRDKHLRPDLFSHLQSTILQKYWLLKEAAIASAQEKDSLMGLMRKLQQYEGRMVRQLKSLQKCKVDYEQSINQLKEKMLQLQINSFFNQKMKSKNQKRQFQSIRKSISADNLIISQIQQDIHLKTINIDQQHTSLDILLLKNNTYNSQQTNDDQLSPICPTSPPSGIQLTHTSLQLEGDDWNRRKLGLIQLSDEVGGRQDQMNYRWNENECGMGDQDDQRDILLRKASEDMGDEQLVGRAVQDIIDNQQGMSVLRECCEYLQDRIEKGLIDEIAQQIFMNSHIYSCYRSYVDHPFQFKPITDHDIYQFLHHQLLLFHPPPLRLHHTINQKINPTSPQILRLIRDFDYQIEQYELVLPEEVFKSYRKHIELMYAEGVASYSFSHQQLREKVSGISNHLLADLIIERQREKIVKKAKFYEFERDLKIMYMKSVFNCFNELIIEMKSSRTFMNARSSIGPGQLSLAIKQYNVEGNQAESFSILEDARQKVVDLIKYKCMLPAFKTYKDLHLFQKQINLQISHEFKESEYKWVNYMDEVLELWQELSHQLIEHLILEAVNELSSIP